MKFWDANYKLAVQMAIKGSDNTDRLTDILAGIGAGLALLAILFYIAFTMAFIIRLHGYG